MIPATAAWALAFATPAAFSADPLIEIYLPAGPTGDGLVRIAELADTPLAMQRGDVSGLVSGAVRGRMRLSQALYRWCMPVRLRCRVRAAGIVVTRIAPAKPPPGIAAKSRPALSPIVPIARVIELPVTSPIIVTGRRGIDPMNRHETSYSLTSLDDEALTRRAAKSMADVLVGVPGVWIDTSAGASANTVRVRGIPLDGYRAIAIQEDGLPVQHDNLPWTDVDQFVRPDIMVERVDYVRGGPSTIFASNAPGGLLNFMTREPRAQSSGTLSASGTSRGQARVDGFITGGIGGGWKAIAGGFATRDPTVRHIGQILGGGQLRVRADRDLASGGHVSIGLRLLADDSLNTSSYPLLRRGDNLVALPGFDPRRDSWFGPDFAVARFATREGGEDRPLGRNNRNRLVASTLSFDMPIGSDFMLVGRGRARLSSTNRYSLLSSGPPVPASVFAEEQRLRLRRQFPQTQNAVLRRANTGEDFSPLPGNDLVAFVQPLIADVRLREFVGDISLSRAIDLGGRHVLTAGVYVVDYHWDYRRVVARALVEARGSGRLIDVVAIDGAGTPVGLATDGGYLNRASTYERTFSDNNVLALYLADEWTIAPNVRIDLGLRQERTWFSGQVEGRTIRAGPDDGTLADDALVLGTGNFTPFANRFGGTSATIALAWQPNDVLGLFARASRGAILPDPGAYRSTPTPSKERTLYVTQGELGITYADRRLSGGLTVFGSRFEDIDVADASIDIVTGTILNRTVQAKTRTIGVEFEGRFRASPAFDVGITGTLQDPRFDAYRFGRLTGDGIVPVSFVGNIPRRLPRWMLGGDLHLRPASIPLSFDVEIQAMGLRYADDANTLKLPGFAILNFGTEWTVNRRMTLRARATNIFDTIAVMQGDAIAGEAIADKSTMGVIIGRALPGRAVELSMRIAW